MPVIPVYYNFDVLPRKELLAMAEYVECILRLNDYKGGWGSMSTSSLIEKLSEEVDEFYDEWNLREKVSPKELGDVIAICMMLLDQEGVLATIQKYAHYRKDNPEIYCSEQSTLALVTVDQNA